MHDERNTHEEIIDWYENSVSSFLSRLQPDKSLISTWTAHD